MPARAAWGLAALAAACALAPALFMWGFAVDDALISVRYAHNLASGAGYRFDAEGPSTDGVTPLPWAFLLWPLVAADPLTTLWRAKVLGVVAWTLGAAVLGGHLGQTLLYASARGRDVAFAAAGLAVMALAFPLGAWAASGMETGVAMALATVAATRLGRPRQAAVVAGLAAALRPEMVVWAVALAALAAVRAEAAPDSDVGESSGAPPRPGSPMRRAAAISVPALLASLPFVACVAVRLAVFGRPAPLAVQAKPSDLEHGALYVAAASVVVLLPLLAFAPVALAQKRAGRARVLALAFVAHAVAVLAVGGDWMPYARLMVPVAPSLVVVFAELSRLTGPTSSVGRLGAALALGGLLAVRAAPAGRHVHAERAALVVLARPLLAESRVVAALDVGWVGAATRARIVDLAGLTDPSIAALPGGHTSKRVDVAMLLDRGVDTVVLYSDPRVVEARILRSELFASRFVATETLLLGARGAHYTVYRRRR